MSDEENMTFDEASFSYQNPHSDEPLTETTLVSVDQPTNPPTYVQPLVEEVIYHGFPSTYMSVRITLIHSQWDILYESCFKDVSWYISYPHMGKNGNNPHFHVLMPADSTRDISRSVR